jgi:hypothetical protein
MALIVVLRRAALRWLGLILALALGSGLAAHLPEMATLAGRFGALPDRLTWPALPDLAPGRVRDLLPSALVIAFLAGIGALLSAVGADRMVLEGAAPAGCRTGGPGSGQPRVRAFRRAAGEGGDRAIGDECARGRADTGRRDVAMRPRFWR